MLTMSGFPCQTRRRYGFAEPARRLCDGRVGDDDRAAGVPVMHPEPAPICAGNVELMLVRWMRPLAIRKIPLSPDGTSLADTPVSRCNRALSAPIAMPLPIT